MNLAVLNSYSLGDLVRITRGNHINEIGSVTYVTGNTITVSFEGNTASSLWAYLGTMFDVNDLELIYKI